MATSLLPANKETKQKKANITGRFLQTQMLGLMARFADVINEQMFAIYTVKEQLRCIRAMEEMIRVCKDYARIARPQVCHLKKS
jgi:serine/threonine-protein kinase ATR